MLDRLIGLADPGIPIHGWFPAWEQYKRGRLGLDALLEAWVDSGGSGSLITKTEAIAQVVPATDKLGLSISHTWADADAVYVTTTGTLPGGITADAIYYVRDSNPVAGTVKVTDSYDGTTLGTAVDITSEGTGTHTLKRMHEDIGYWDRTRSSVTSVTGTSEQKLLRVLWDLKAEGVAISCNEELLTRTVASLKTEVETLATWLDEAL